MNIVISDCSNHKHPSQESFLLKILLQQIFFFNEIQFRVLKGQKNSKIKC